ncbi:hypothetical protein LCGC14_1621960 [marine sediment metagenome]|uniref:Uncharacterized protein n=1 Tax=marine sediment metagenome TaxID=412755 RepID=A0A0F9L587_9ZZZZ
MTRKPNKTRRSAEDIVAKAATKTSEIELSKARGEIARWKRKHKAAVQEAAAQSDRAETALGIGAHTPSVISFEKSRVYSGMAAAIIPATDWHVEERVRPEQVNGKNSFDLAEAEKRIERFYSEGLRMIEEQCDPKIDEIWHPMLGDLMSGYIHEELEETNSLTPVETISFLQDMICSGLDLWIKKTKLPIFIPTCVGNHGRTTKKTRVKTRVRNSYEWLLYATLAKYYAKNPRVHWMIGEGYHNIQIIKSRLVRFHHGDGMRYQGGVGGITIPVNKAVAAWDEIEQVDFDIFGHWHTFKVDYPKWIACGSLIGYSEFSLWIKAKFQHPTQVFCVLDADYGIVRADPIFLTDPVRSQGRK